MLLDLVEERLVADSQQGRRLAPVPVHAVQVGIVRSRSACSMAARASSGATTPPHRAEARRRSEAQELVGTVARRRPLRRGPAVSIIEPQCLVPRMTNRFTTLSSSRILPGQLAAVVYRAYLELEQRLQFIGPRA